MNIKVLGLIFVNLLLFNLEDSFSQKTISGKIVDTLNKPLSANIFVNDYTQNKIVTIETSDKSGSFLINLPDLHNIELVVRSTGFKEQIIKVKDTISQNIIVRMEEASNTLKEVTVSASKPLIERKIDRLVFKVENSISTIGTDAYEVLSKAPSVRIQAESIGIIGRNSVSVTINSRFTHMSGTSLVNYLRTINAEEIKEIEIITNPSAKYDASGNSGLINIILKKNNVVGFNGSLNTGVLLGKYPTAGLTNLFNYNVNKIHINSNLTGSLGKNYSYTNSFFDRPDFGSYDFYTNVSKRKSFRGSISVDYDASKSTSLGLKFEQSINRVDNSNIRNITFKSTIIDSLITTPGYNDISFNNTSAYFYIQHEIDTNGKKLVFDINYLRYGNESNSLYVSRTFDTQTNENTNIDAITSLNDQTSHILSSSIDFTFPLRSVDLEYGGKASFIKNNNLLDYSVSSFLPQGQLNLFDYSENIFSLYLSGEKKIKSWEFKAGLRMEHTYTNAISSTTFSNFKNNYTSYFPTVYVNYKINETKTLGISYGKRITRPYFDFLNPSRVYSSIYNYEEGNPYLLPSFTHNFELSLTTEKLLTSIYASILKNGFSNLTIVNPQGSTSIRTAQNFLDNYQYGLSESYTFNKKKWFESNNQFNIYFSEDIFDERLNVNKRKYISSYFSTDNTFIINKKKTIRTNVRFSYQFPEMFDFDKREGYYVLSASFSANLLKRKLTIAMSGNDILKSGKIITNGIANNVVRRFEYYTDNRTFRLALIYRFGTNKNDKRFRDTSMEESTRIKNN
jgi:effector-binding domain-containing protein